MKKVISGIFFIISLLTMASIVAEFFFAGLGVFHATSFSLHQTTGEVITLSSFLLLVLSLVGLLGRTRILFSLLLVILMILQNLLVHLNNSYIEALHPLNGLAIMGVTAMLVRSGNLKTTTK